MDFAGDVSLSGAHDLETIHLTFFATPVGA